MQTNIRFPFTQPKGNILLLILPVFPEEKYLSRNQTLQSALAINGMKKRFNNPITDD